MKFETYGSYTHGPRVVCTIRTILQCPATYENLLSQEKVIGKVDSSTSVARARCADGHFQLRLTNDMNRGMNVHVWHSMTDSIDQFERH